jgi:hypothetical protein
MDFDTTTGVLDRLASATRERRLAVRAVAGTAALSSRLP